jgi:hypothetical protein
MNKVEILAERVNVQAHFFLPEGVFIDNNTATLKLARK